MEEFRMECMWSSEGTIKIFPEFHVTQDILTDQPLRMCKYY